MKRFFLLSVLVLSSGNLANAQEGGMESGRLHALRRGK